MKRILSTIILCGLMLITKAQDPGIEKSFFGVQIGTFGVWIHNEAKLIRLISLRSEFGISCGLSVGSRGINYLYMTPGISIEPRWYYNLLKRNSKGRDTSFNSGNILSIKIGYSPDWVILSNSDNVNKDNVIYMIPTWGIRRNIGEKFNYEVGAGIGYGFTFNDNGQSDNEVAYNLHLRIGYTF